MTTDMSHPHRPTKGSRPRGGSPNFSLLPNPPPGPRLEQIANEIEATGERRYRFRQLMAAVRRGVMSFEEVSELPKGLRTHLADRFGQRVLPLEVVAASSTRQVDKVLFETSRGERIETVHARYRKGWTSLCISSQAGCGLGCTFCATGAVGLMRNLTADEIVGQVLHPRWLTHDGRPPTSISFMGMGEALANPHVFGALEALTDPDVGARSPRRITVSTVGFAPNLERLVREHPQVTVTLSVHSPFGDERGRLIPLQDRYPLADNLALLDEHVMRSRRKTYLAYLLIADLNDSDRHAKALAELVAERSRPELFSVSVIAYNDAAGVGPSFSAPSPSAVAAFVAALRRRGAHASRRSQFGSSVDAACGQLHATYLDPPSRRE